MAGKLWIWLLGLVMAGSAAGLATFIDQPNARAISSITSTATPASSVTTASATQQSSPVRSRQWRLTRRADQLTDDPIVEARIALPNDPYQVSVTVSCQAGHIFSYRFGISRMDGRPTELHPAVSRQTNLQVRLNDGEVFELGAVVLRDEGRRRIARIMSNDVSGDIQRFDAEGVGSLLIQMGLADDVRVRLSASDGAPFVQFQQAGSEVQQVMSECGISIDAVRMAIEDARQAREERRQEASAAHLASVTAAIARQARPCTDAIDVPVSARQIVSLVEVTLDRAGSLLGQPRLAAQEGVNSSNAVYAEQVGRLVVAAFMRCAPFRGLGSEIVGSDGRAAFTVRVDLGG